MATPVQLSMFDSPGGDTESLQGFSVPSKELLPPPPKVETNATKKRDKRRTWYLQTVIKKPKSDGPTVA